MKPGVASWFSNPWRSSHLVAATGSEEPGAHGDGTSGQYWPKSSPFTWGQMSTGLIFRVILSSSLAFIVLLTIIYRIRCCI